MIPFSFFFYVVLPGIKPISRAVFLYENAIPKVKSIKIMCGRLEICIRKRGFNGGGGFSGNPLSHTGLEIIIFVQRFLCRRDRF